MFNLFCSKTSIKRKKKCMITDFENLWFLYALHLRNANSIFRFYC